VVKLVGAICIILCASWIGFAIARRYRDRPRQLMEFVTALKMLETDISYLSLPLPTALRRISERVSQPVSTIFLRTAEGLECGDGRPVFDHWRTALRESRHAISLTKSDLHILQQFGHTLGVSDRKDQIQHIHGVCNLLQISEQQARSEQEQQEKMWRYIGVLSGIVLVILLF
jgi:stage III sporulation protein AB